MFDSLFATTTSFITVFLMALMALFDGVLAAFILSRKVRSGKEFFITVALMPLIVAVAFFFLNVMNGFMY